MMKIVVGRTGSPLYCNLKKATSPRGEWDTLPFLHWVSKQPDIEAVYWGRAIEPEHSPVPVIPLDLSDIDEWSSFNDLVERCAPGLERIKEFNPTAFVDYNGAPPSWSNPDNPNGALVQASGVRYNFPALWAMHKLGLPRVCIVTDPKCYSRDSEMATIWKNIQPIAVLSQEDVVWDRIIQGKRFKVCAVRSGAEFWNTSMWDVLERTADKQTMIMGHSHFKTSRIMKGRESIYDKMFTEVPDDFTIIGKGWDGNPYWAGTLPTLDDIRELMREFKSGTFLPQKRGFNSTKPRIFAMSGCCPCPYGTDPEAPLTYDPYGYIVPIDSPVRVREGESLLAHSKRVSDSLLEETNLEVLERTTPDFSKLLNCLDGVASKRDVTTPEWRKEFGGYIEL